MRNVVRSRSLCIVPPSGRTHETRNAGGATKNPVHRSNSLGIQRDDAPISSKLVEDELSPPVGVAKIVELFSKSKSTPNLSDRPATKLAHSVSAHEDRRFNEDGDNKYDESQQPLSGIVKSKKLQTPRDVKARHDTKSFARFKRSADSGYIETESDSHSSQSVDLGKSEGHSTKSSDLKNKKMANDEEDDRRAKTSDTESEKEEAGEMGEEFRLAAPVIAEIVQVQYKRSETVEERKARLLNLRQAWFQSKPSTNPTDLQKTNSSQNSAWVRQEVTAPESLLENKLTNRTVAGSSKVSGNIHLVPDVPQKPTNEHSSNAHSTVNLNLLLASGKRVSSSQDTQVSRIVPISVWGNLQKNDDRSTSGIQVSDPNDTGNVPVTYGQGFNRYDAGATNAIPRSGSFDRLRAADIEKCTSYRSESKQFTKVWDKGAIVSELREEKIRGDSRSLNCGQQCERVIELPTMKTSQTAKRETQQYVDADSARVTRQKTQIKTERSMKTEKATAPDREDVKFPSAPSKSAAATSSELRRKFNSSDR